MPVGDTPLKLTRDAKAAVQLVFEQLGDTERLLEWANNPANLGVFYTQIWSKIIPKDIKADIDGQIVIEVAQFGSDKLIEERQKREAIEVSSKLIGEQCGQYDED